MSCQCFHTVLFISRLLMTAGFRVDESGRSTKVCLFWKMEKPAELTCVIPPMHTLIDIGRPASVSESQDINLPHLSYRGMKSFVVICVWTWGTSRLFKKLVTSVWKELKAGKLRYQGCSPKYAETIIMNWIFFTFFPFHLKEPTTLSAVNSVVYATLAWKVILIEKQGSFSQH